MDKIVGAYHNYRAHFSTELVINNVVKSLSSFNYLIIIFQHSYL
jgi:hypothetical protein